MRDALSDTPPRDALPGALGRTICQAIRGLRSRGRAMTTQSEWDSDYRETAAQCGRIARRAPPKHRRVAQKFADELLVLAAASRYYWSGEPAPDHQGDARDFVQRVGRECRPDLGVRIRRCLSKMSDPSVPARVGAIGEAVVLLLDTPRELRMVERFARFIPRSPGLRRARIAADLVAEAHARMPADRVRLVAALYPAIVGGPVDPAEHAEAIRGMRPYPAVVRLMNLAVADENRIPDVRVLGGPAGRPRPVYSRELAVELMREETRWAAKDLARQRAAAAAGVRPAQQEPERERERQRQEEADHVHIPVKIGDRHQATVEPVLGPAQGGTPPPRERPARDHRVYTCSNCGAPGHNRRTCPNRDGLEGRGKESKDGGLLERAPPPPSSLTAELALQVATNDRLKRDLRRALAELEEARCELARSANASVQTSPKRIRTE